MAFTIDVDEGKWSKEVLQILLIDRTTNRNIIWGTDDYEALGKEYNLHYPILLEIITGKNSGVIQPRILKTKKIKVIEQKGKRKFLRRAGFAMHKITLWIMLGLAVKIYLIEKLKKVGKRT